MSLRRRFVFYTSVLFSLKAMFIFLECTLHIGAGILAEGGKCVKIGAKGGVLPPRYDIQNVRRPLRNADDGGQPPLGS